jgi:hypothetical protein
MSAKRWRLARLGLATATLFPLLASSLLAAQVSGTVPMAPNSKITPIGPQRQQPPGRQQPAVNGRYQAAPAPSRVQMNVGTVEGFVYWDADQMSHIPAASCSGLAITVNVGSSSGGPLVSYTPLATLSNNFKFIGRVQGLSGGKTVTYNVCAFGYDHVPVGPNLQVKLSITQPLAFSPIAAPQFEVLGPINIINAQCNMLPRIMNPTVGDLTGHWGSCQNMAYGVSFALIHPVMLHTLSSSGGSGGMLGGAAGSGTLLNHGATSSTLAISPTVPAGNTGSPGSRAGIQPGVKNADDLNPQPYPPKGTGVRAGTVQDSSVYSVLEQQGLSRKKMPTMNTNAKREASAAVDAGAKAQIRAKLQSQFASARVLMKTAVGTAPALSEAPELRTLQQQKMYVDGFRTQPGSGSRVPMISPQVNRTIVQNVAESNPKLHAPPTMVCMTPQIRAVNGKTSGVVFTQDPQFNDYIITGCGFGTQGGQVYLSGAVTGGRINMVVKPQQWSDTQIAAEVEPGLTGVLDGWPDLVVAPSNVATPAKFPGARFYAQRESVLLPNIPQQYASLANVTVGDSTHGFGTQYCAGPDVGHLFPCISFNAGPPLDGVTNGHDHRGDPSQTVSNAVDRDGGQLEFKSGEDVYDLSYMAPGFDIDYFVAFWYAWTEDVCEGWANESQKAGDSVGYETNGYYRFYKKTRTKLVVDWGVDHCAWRWLGIFRVDDWYNSGYSLQVYVKGPIGIDPWTGHAIGKPKGLLPSAPVKIVRTP